MANKTQAMVTFLQSCPALNGDTVFFNFGNVQDNAHQFVTRADDISLQKPFIDGSVSKRYTFIIDTFKSISFNPMVVGYDDENIDDFSNVQQLVDWVNEMGESRVFPDFGNECIIDEMKTLSSKPELLTVDRQVNPPIAVYRVQIQIDYIDNSKKIWG